MTMALLSLACLPELRLTDRGLIDCRTFRFVPLIVGGRGMKLGLVQMPVTDVPEHNLSEAVRLTREIPSRGRSGTVAGNVSVPL